MENNEIKKTKLGKVILPNGSKLFDSHYIVENYIDSGGMADIYLIRDPQIPDKKLVAKIVYQKSAKITEFAWSKVRWEAKNALRVYGKPNLVQTYRVFPGNDEQDPSLVFVMDYVEGIDLKKYLNKYGCMAPKVALNVFLKICNGIKTLHSFKRQIIHRDLKPENIILSHDLSDVTIIDFGIATVLDRTELAIASENNAKLFTDEQHQYGTANYIIPDSLNEYNKKDPTTRKITVQYDFFSLGIILYEMLIGKKPFDYPKGTSQSKIIRLPLNNDMLNISANPSIPTSLENIIFRCIASRPIDIKYRYNDINEIIEDVKKVIPLLNKEDPTPLLKPLHTRIYQHAHLFNIDRVKENQKIYKQWWFLIMVVGMSLIFIIACILVFFVI